MFDLLNSAMHVLAQVGEVAPAVQSGATEAAGLAVSAAPSAATVGTTAADVAQGGVLNASVRSSSGYSRLDEAALKAARSARFKPYTENGIAYQAMADIPFDFVL